MHEAKHNQPTPARTSRRFNLVSAILAFVLWGVWAYIVNGGAITGTVRGAPLAAAITQGCGSFIATLIMVSLVTWLYNLLPVNSTRRILPAIITVAITGSCLATAHAIVGTPEIIPTIAPALIVAFSFNLYTTFKLHHNANDQGNNRDTTRAV